MSTRSKDFHRNSPKIDYLDQRERDKKEVRNLKIISCLKNSEKAKKESISSATTTLLHEFLKRFPSDISNSYDNTFFLKHIIIFKYKFSTKDLRTAVVTGRISNIKNPKKERAKNEIQLATFEKLDLLMNRMLEKL